MPAAPLAAPFNLDGWIGAHLPHALGAIGNKEVFKGSDFIFQIIKGPNARNDFHLDPWDEIFYQLKGHIFVHVIEAGQERRIRIGEGEVFLLPKHTYHSPRRPPGSVGLVVERPRAPDELDGFAWFCPACAGKLHEVSFWCDDIETALPAVIRTFNADLSLRSCKRCGAVLPDPTSYDHWDPVRAADWA
jgi:3-hydroxyanthranilate 3,4-dioxygenase